MERTRDEVRIPSPATAELVAHTLREVIKFLLYVRQQLPCSYDDLRSGLEESMGPEALGAGEGQRRADFLPGLKRKRATSGERRFLKLFKELEAMLSRVTPQMLQETRATELALLLGSTPLRPKEMYTFVLSDASSSYAPYEPAPVTERMMDNAARRVIRECLPAVAGCPSAAAPMKVFVLVKVPTPETGGGEAEGFLPKRGFAPLLRQTKIAADFVMKVKRAEGDVVQGGGVVQGLPGMWYQCVSSVKGVKGPGS